MSDQIQDRLNVALVQADLVWAHPQANRDRLALLMDAQSAADLYVLPETFTTGFLGDVDLDNEPMEGPTLQWMAEQARARNAAVCGSFVVTESGRRRNRFVFVDAAGTCLGHYDKRHLFGPGGEGERYQAGNAPCVIEWQGWRIDLQICYDLRFPVWCRNDRAFDLQLFVANWPSPRIAHWQALLRARAIENQAFVVAVNRTGTDGNAVNYSGHSLAFEPSGNALAELDDAESVALIELDIERLRAYRSGLPFLNDADRFTRQA